MQPRLVFVTLVLTSRLAALPSALAQIGPAPDPPSTAPAPLDDLTVEQSPARLDLTTQLAEQRRALQAAPDDVSAHLRTAEGLYRTGDLDAALDECRMALSLNPGSTDAHLQLGVLLMAKQDWRQAAAALQEALRLDPTLTQAHYNLGSVHYAQGRLKAAVHAYEQALSLQPDFPDARYRLALVLKVENRHRDAIPHLEAAAAGGIPQAQFFLGNAYRHGHGVSSDLAQAVAWWVRADRSGYQPATDALSKLRRQALATAGSTARQTEAQAAFRAFRGTLWEPFPDMVRQTDTDSLGAALLQQGRLEDALAILLWETATLSEPAQQTLAQLYETGWHDSLAPFDTRILQCLNRTAADGFLPSSITLARIHALGLGVPPDREKATAALKGLPKHEQRVRLDELGLH